MLDIARFWCIGVLVQVMVYWRIGFGVLVLVLVYWRIGFGVLDALCWCSINCYFDLAHSTGIGVLVLVHLINCHLYLVMVLVYWCPCGLLVFGFGVLGVLSVLVHWCTWCTVLVLGSWHWSPPLIARLFWFCCCVLLWSTTWLHLSTFGKAKLSCSEALWVVLFETTLKYL